jgi:hypothetical protein
VHRVDKIDLKGVFDTRDAAASALRDSGDAAIVVRGLPRLLLIRCPCGCGDDILLNLDRRSGAAWRLYQRGKAVTVYPSYWRDTKCGSHFIVWNSKVVWCDWLGYSSVWDESSAIADRVWVRLTDEFRSYDEIAEEIQETPWDVLQACYSLMRNGRAEAHGDRRTRQFKRRGN